MDKNTPLSSLPSSEHEMESKGKNIAPKKVEKDPNEPSQLSIMNILNYSKALKVETTKSVLQHVEYIKN
jgi:hypothetical protein